MTVVYRLKPYEILKGKLLGQIDKLELDSGNYNALWEESVQAVNGYREDEIDSCFRYWLKAKFSNSRKEGQKFDGDYHREMFKPELDKDLKLDHNSVGAKAFLNGSFRYYTGLYARLFGATRKPSDQSMPVYCNSLNEQDNQFMLVLAACKVDDPDEAAKIQAVAVGLDRMFSLLQLQGAYDSNQYTTRLFAISTDIRDRPAAEIAGIFDKHLVDELRDRRGNPELVEAFNWALFKPMSIDRLNTRFARYFFARVELLLSRGMKQQMPHALGDLVTLRGAVNGFHIEHILSRNAANLALFGDDEERFEQERNRLGVFASEGKGQHFEWKRAVQRKAEVVPPVPCCGIRRF